MARDNILLIHIGTPKTGSTALQKFFCDNREILNERGWRYPKLKERFRNYKTNDPDVKKNGNFLFRQDGQVLEQGEQWNDIWKVIKEELIHGNVILSSEEMFELETDKILQCVKAEYSNVKVIVYLRRQDDYIEANWKQAIKVGVCTDNIQEWNRKLYSQEQFVKAVHYYNKLKCIENIVGKENLIVRPYEREQFEGEWKDIVSDFLKYIGVSDLSGFSKVYEENVSYEGVVLEAKRVLNASYSMSDKCYVDVNYFVRCALEKNMDSDHKRKYSYLTKEERLTILNTFNEENIRIAHEYLGRKDGVLFYNNELAYDEYVIDYKQLFEYTIKLYGNMIIEHEKKIKSENTSLRLLELKLQVISSGRDIVLYGAGERCRWLLRYTKLKELKIVDNDLSIQGNMLNEITVENPMKYIDKNKYVIVVTCRQYDDIKQQLENNGLVDGVDFVLMSDYIY